MCDGYGNCLADEGEHKGEPVAFHDGSFVFVQKGEKSHNERHHKKFAEMTGTQSEDPNSPGYAGTEDKPVKGAEHHFGVMPDDSHAHGLRFDPDKVAARSTGHTNAWKGGSEDE